MDTFRNSFFFDFFFEFLQVLISRLHWSRKVRKKSPQKKFGHFWKRFSGFWKIDFFFIFFEIFRFLDPSGCTGRIFLPEKIPRSMLKTNLNTFGNVFGHFENWKFSSFLKFFPVWTFQGAQGNFSRENYLKTSLKFVWTLLGPFLDTFEISNFCRFFFRIFPSFDPPGCTGQFFKQKNYLEACSKRFWTFLGMYLGFLKKNESFSLFLTFFQVSTLQRALGKIFFQKNTSKQFQHLFEKLLRTFLDTFRNSIFSIFFSNFYKFWSPGCTGQEKFGKNHLRRNLDTFGNVFRDFEKLIFFSIFWIFSISRPSRVHWANFFTGKNTSKHVPNMFDCFWERFLGNLKNWKFFQFFGIFPSFDSPGCTGRFFPKKITSKQFQNLFGHF